MWRHDQRPTACASVRWPVGRRFRTDPALLRRARAGDGHAPEPARLAPLRRSPGRQGAAHQRAPGAARLQPARDQHDPSGPRPHRRAARRARRARRCASRRQILQEGCASRAVSTPMWQASWRASPNSWARSTNRWRAPRPYSRAWTRQRPPHPPGLRRPQSDLLRHSRPKRRGDSGRERRERRVVEAMGLGNRLTGDGTPHDVDALGKAGSSSTAWRQPPAAMASV